MVVNFPLKILEEDKHVTYYSCEVLEMYTPLNDCCLIIPDNRTKDQGGVILNFHHATTSASIYLRTIEKYYGYNNTHDLILVLSYFKEDKFLSGILAKPLHVKSGSYRESRYDIRATILNEQEVELWKQLLLSEEKENEASV